MILVDTSVWVDHLHRGVPAMASLLDDETVLMHPFVIGELAGTIGRGPEAAYRVRLHRSHACASGLEHFE